MFESVRPVIESLGDRVANVVLPAAAQPVLPAPIQDRVDRMWTDRLATLDLAAVRERFLADGDFVVLPGLVPPAMCAEALTEIDQSRPTRSRMPWVRSAQHVGWRTLQRIAPVTAAIYCSPVFIDWMSELVGTPMRLKHPDDEHSCASYEYDRAGDGMKFHYDTCGCEEGASYSQLLSLRDRSTQRLLVELHHKDGRPIEKRAIQTLAGTLTLFCGSKVWHGVSPLGPGERRVILSMSYASDPYMPPWRRLRENVKDAILYFGPGALFQRNFRKR